MLEDFLKQAFQKHKTAQANKEIHALLLQFPNEELRKLAMGEPLPKAEGNTWIDQFKGTPYFEQAVALEQESIQLQLERNQRNQEQSLENSTIDAIDLKKRLLELQSATDGVQAEQAAEEEAVVQEQAAAQQAEQEEPKAVKKEEKTTYETPKEEKSEESAPADKVAAWVAVADQAARAMARSDYAKLAAQKEAAPSMAGMKALGQGAVGFLKKNPGAAIGAGIGAAGGLAHGLQKDEHGNRSIAKGLAQGVAGAAGGAAVGHGVSTLRNNLAHAAATGGTKGEALLATGRQMKFQGGQAMDAVKNAVNPKTMGATPVPNLQQTAVGMGRAPTVHAGPAAAPPVSGVVAKPAQPRPGFVPPTPLAPGQTIPRMNPDQVKTMVH